MRCTATVVFDIISPKTFNRLIINENYLWHVSCFEFLCAHIFVMVTYSTGIQLAKLPQWNMSCNFIVSALNAPVIQPFEGLDV